MKKVQSWFKKWGRYIVIIISGVILILIKYWPKNEKPAEPSTITQSSTITVDSSKVDKLTNQPVQIIQPKEKVEINQVQRDQVKGNKIEKQENNYYPTVKPYQRKLTAGDIAKLKTIPKNKGVLYFTLAGDNESLRYCIDIEQKAIQLGHPTTGKGTYQWYIAPPHPNDKFVIMPDLDTNQVFIRVFAEIKK